MLKFYNVIGQLCINGQTYPAVRFGYSLEEEILNLKRRTMHLNWLDIETGKLYRITKHLFTYMRGSKFKSPEIIIYGEGIHIRKKKYPELDIVVSVWLEENQNPSSSDLLLINDPKLIFKYLQQETRGKDAD